MKTTCPARLALCLLAVLLLAVSAAHADIPADGLPEGIIINGPVSVFDGTWSNANFIGTLQNGDPVLILQQAGPLFQVFSRVNRLAGWIPAANVRINQTPPITVGVVISQNVTLRQSPSTTAKQLARPANGAVLYILGVQGDWYHVRFYDAGNTQLEGYVRTHFVVENPAFVTTTKNTYVYAIPSRQSKMVGELVPGTQLVVIGEFGDFWVVNLRSASGFIHKSDIEYGQIEGNG